MIASKLILFFCFCLLLLDNSIGKIKKSPLERGKYKRLFEQAFKFGKTYGGKLRELGSQWDDLVDEIDQANRKVGFGIGELARFNEASKEVSLAQEDVDSYEELYSNAPTRENKEKLDAAKDIHSRKVEIVIALRSHDIIVDRNHIKDLEDKKDHVAIEMIARYDQLRKKLKKKNIRTKIREAKKNGLNDSDIKKILFAEFFRPSDGPLIGGGDALADALLSSFRAGVQSIVDDDYHGIISKKSGNGGGDDGTPEGTPSDGGDDGAPEGTPSDGGDDGAPEGTPSDGGDDGAPEGPPSDGGDDGIPEGRGEDFDSIDMNTIEAIESLYPGIEGNTIDDIEKWYFALDDQSNSNIKHAIIDQSRYRNPPQYSDEEIIKATRIVNAHKETTRSRTQYFRDQVDLLFEERRLGHYNYITSPESSLTDEEEVNLYQIIADRIQTSLDTIESIREDFDKFYVQFRQDFTFTRKNFDHYGARLGANASRFSPYTIIPGRPGDIPEFYNTPEDDWRFRYLLSRTSMDEFINVGISLDKIDHDLEEEKYSLVSELKDLKEIIAEKG